MKPSLEIRDPAQAQYTSDATAHVHAVENHFVHLYEDATSLGEVVADYLTAGLNVGQAAVAFITEPHRRALFDLLGARGVDVAGACASGQLSVFDARETLARLMVGLTPNRDLFAKSVGPALDGALSRSGGRGVRAYGDMVDLLFHDGKPRAALRLEELWSELQRVHGFSLLCAYALDHVSRDARQLDRVCGAHTRVLELSRPDSVPPAPRNGSRNRVPHARALLSEIAKRKDLEHAVRDVRAELSAAAARTQLLDADTQQAHKRARLLCSLAATVSRATELAPVLERALDTLGEALGVERGAVLVAGPEGPLSFRAWRGLSESFRRVAPPLLNCGVQPRAVSDVDCELELLGYLPVFRAEQIAAFVELPLLCGEQRMGQLTIYYRRPYAVGNSELEFAVAVADHLAAAIARFSCHAELARNAQYSRLFAGILGSDVRNQLAPILMGAQLAADRADSDGLLRPLASVLRSGERMVRMIDQLLDLTQLRAGSGLAINAARSDLLPVLRQVVDELDDTNPELLLSLTQSGDDTEGDWDSDRMCQVFFNLVANAVEHGHTEAGVQVHVDGNDRHALHVEVRNRGAIPASLVPKLFEPLTGPDRQSEGLGLGLHIAREIVKAHGGEIDVESTEAGETVFRVTLPRQAPCVRPNAGLPSEFFAQN